MMCMSCGASFPVLHIARNPDGTCPSNHYYCNTCYTDISVADFVVIVGLEDGTFVVLTRPEQCLGCDWHLSELVPRYFGDSAMHVNHAGQGNVGNGNEADEFAEMDCADDSRVSDEEEILDGKDLIVEPGTDKEKQVGNEQKMDREIAETVPIFEGGNLDSPDVLVETPCYAQEIHRYPAVQNDGYMVDELHLNDLNVADDDNGGHLDNVNAKMLGNTILLSDRNSQYEISDEDDNEDAIDKNNFENGYNAEKVQSILEADPPVFGEHDVVENSMFHWEAGAGAAVNVPFEPIWRGLESEPINEESAEVVFEEKQTEVEQEQVEFRRTEMEMDTCAAEPSIIEDEPISLEMETTATEREPFVMHLEHITAVMEPTGSTIVEPHKEPALEVAHETNVPNQSKEETSDQVNAVMDYVDDATEVMCPICKDSDDATDTWYIPADANGTFCNGNHKYHRGCLEQDIITRITDPSPRLVTCSLCIKRYQILVPEQAGPVLWFQYAANTNEVVFEVIGYKEQ